MAGMSRNWTDPSDKAVSLLISWLNPQQRKDFLRHGYFYVTGGQTGTTYRVNRATAPFNVEVLNPQGLTRDRLCFLPTEAPFVGDVMLAQKIGLEKMEEHVLKIANRYNRWHTMIPIDDSA